MGGLWILGGTIALALSLVVSAVHAGGWATVTLDRPLKEARTGESIEVGFMVKQHGTTPIHAVNGQALEPVFVAAHQESGDRIETRAMPSKTVGHFAAQVRFPRDGTWYAEIVPAPFAGTKLEPITVLAATGAVASLAATDEQVITTSTPATAAGESSGTALDTLGAIDLVSAVVIAAGAALVGGLRLRSASRPAR